MTPLRVLVADDHPLFRNGIATALAGIPDIALVGEAADGDTAISRTLELLPDVVLMDLQMPGTNGIDATRQIAAKTTQVRILVLTMFEDDGSVFAAMRAGAPATSSRAQARTTSNARSATSPPAKPFSAPPSRPASSTSSRHPRT